MSYYISRSFNSACKTISVTVLLLLGGSAIASDRDSASAQIIPDNTLGAESSIVNPIDRQVDRIDGGALRGNNLFHSFQEFNIGEGRAAYFANPALIRNIFSRVTGTNPSHLFGKLGVLGNANLFFINPNGIIFGPNASLDIRGSFFATTFPKIVFPDGNEFSALNPQEPPLIKVEVKPIVGVYFEGTGEFITNAADLAVPKGENITLAGRKVTSTGSIAAPGGTVQVLGTESVALQENAKIDVSSPDGGGTVLIGGDFQGKGTVPTSARTLIDKNVSIKADALTNGDGGKVIVWADEVTGFYGNISAKGGSVSGNGGEVEVSGKEQLIFRGDVNTSAINGRSGTLLLDPKNIVIANGNGDSATDGADTFAGNNSGAIGSILSTPLSQIQDEAPTTIYESELEGLSGNNNLVLQASNDIRLNDLTDNELKLAPGTGSIFLSADADSDGVGSFVMEDAIDSIKTSGRDISISGASLAIANIDTSNSTQTIADSGAISLNATNGSISAGNLNAAGTGNGGAVSFNSAGEIVLSGTVDVSGESGNGGDVTLNAFGNITIHPGSDIASVGLLGGNINLKSSGDISAANSNILSVSFGNDGTGGDMNVIARSLLFSNIFLGTVALGKANAGNIKIQASDSVFIAGSNNGQSSGIKSLVFTGAEGNGGKVTLETNHLRITDGNTISADTQGKGNAGELKVRANTVELIGSNPINGLGSNLSNSALPGSEGNAGDLTVETNSLRLVDGGAIASATFSRGNGGSLTVRANSVEIIGANLFNTSLATGLNTSVQQGAIGNAGDLLIETNSLRLVDGGQIGAATFGEGNAGSLTVRANSVEVIGVNPVRGSNFPSGLFTSVQPTAMGNAGDLNIETNNLLLTNGGAIAANTLGKGDAGTINIQATSSIILRDNGQIGVNSTSSGVGGNIELRSESLTLDKGTITAETASNTGGNITLQVEDLLLLRNGSKISATAGTARAGGDGGNININAGSIVAIPKENSDITANAFFGNGGRIEINAQGILGIQYRQQETPLSDITVSSTFGSAGTVEINALEIAIDRDAVQIPKQLVASFFRIGCGPRSGVEFFNIGRGGSLPSPEDMLGNETIIVNWIDPITEEQSDKEKKINSQQTSRATTASTSAFIPACR